MPHLSRRRVSALVTVLNAVLTVSLLSGCSDDDDRTQTVPATFAVQPGVEQVTVTNAAPGSTLVLVDDSGRRILGLKPDTLGQATFSYIPGEYLEVQTGDGVLPTDQGTTLKSGTYTLRNEAVRPIEESAPFQVLGRDDVPPTSLYEGQTLAEGFSYIEVRDGVRLSVMVRFPDRGQWGNGPWPTLVEYSGYAPSNPDSPEPGSMIASLLGYATVGVNMRGTGCSGGVFDVFNPAQQADGYDIIETIARQPWVLHNKVGMVGLSYSGISQLFVASTQPPSLAAITPLSVIEDPWREQWPGGIYNSGFTRQWLAERDREAGAGGQGWVQRRIAGGDTQCADNQNIRSQNIDFEVLGHALEFYPEDSDARRLTLLVRDINVPVYLTGAWQDEQTGSLFTHLLDDFDSTDTKKFILFNGRHPDGYSPGVITRWWEFLEIYVAKRIPRLDPILRALAPAAFQEAFGVAGLGFEPDRFPDVTTYEEVLARYEAEPEVRVLFEFGAGHRVAGAPIKRYEASFDSWPPPAQPRSWYFDSDGTLSDDPPQTSEVDRYQHDPAAGAITYVDGNATDFLRPIIQFNWPPLAEGYGLSYVSEPLEQDVVVVGDGGYVNLWLASDASDPTVEVTLTEVRPDGLEYIVQSGVLRVGHRKIDDALSNTFLIDYTFREDDFEPVTPGRFIETKVPLRPFGHAFRAGSRVRLVIDTPGRDSPLWAYENPAYSGPVFNSVEHSPARISYVLLPVVDGVEVPPTLPPCPSLRGQICREYVALENQH